jgi:hypothetical protein
MRGKKYLCVCTIFSQDCKEPNICVEVAEENSENLRRNISARLRFEPETSQYESRTSLPFGLFSRHTGGLLLKTVPRFDLKTRAPARHYSDNGRSLGEFCKYFIHVKSLWSKSTSSKNNEPELLSKFVPY